MSLINVRVLFVIAGVVSSGFAQFYPSRVAPCQQPYLTPFGSSRNENGNSNININENTNTNANANQALRYSGSGLIPQLPLPQLPLPQLPLPRPPFPLPFPPIRAPFLSSQPPRPLSSISRYTSNPMLNIVPNKNIDDNVNANVNINSNQNYNENANANSYIAPMMATRPILPPPRPMPIISPAITRPALWTRPSVSYGGYPVGNLNANANENTNVNINDNGNVNANAFRRNMHGSSNE